MGMELDFKNRFIKFLPLFLLVLFFLWRNLHKPSFEAFARQEGPIEIAQAICYFIASALILIFAVRIKDMIRLPLFIILIGLGLFFFLIGMEEISWGQSLLDFSTPEAIKKINTQGELTLHNLDIFQKSFLLHMFFVVFCTAFIFSKQILRFVEKRVPSLDRITEFSLNKDLILFFLIPAIYYIFLEFFTIPLDNAFPAIEFLDAPDQEMFEFILCLGVFLYSISIVKKSKFLKS